MSRRSTKTTAKDGARQLWNVLQACNFYPWLQFFFANFYCFTAIKIKSDCSQPSCAVSWRDCLMNSLMSFPSSSLQSGAWPTGPTAAASQTDPTLSLKVPNTNKTKQWKTYSTRSFKTYFDILHYWNHMLWIHITAFVVLICIEKKAHCTVSSITITVRPFIKLSGRKYRTILTDRGGLITAFRRQVMHNTTYLLFVGINHLKNKICLNEECFVWPSAVSWWLNLAGIRKLFGFGDKM